MQQYLYTHSIIDTVATHIAEMMKSYGIHIITLSGPLGAGKTTITRAIGKLLGVQSSITSPTYTYLQRYEASEGKNIYHFDLYRITTQDEFLSMGFDEYLHDENNIVIIEWPEIIDDLISYDRCCVTLAYGDHEDERIMTISVKKGVSV